MKTTSHTKEGLNDTARRMAQHANDDLMHQHRGVIRTGTRVHVVFGNDGYGTDARSRAEAEAVKACAEQDGHVASDIQTDKDGVTWAVAVVCGRGEAATLGGVAWETWKRESENRATTDTPACFLRQ